ncbi:hypothetical protein [Hymenobacter negativus]|uniref:Uncharacterized protein n=1 Tax=Hymenobacter negativus TaxID=2795026 RepID=A0ABS0Q8M3_9BACT|nr:hypothetical protein [Hymenobacter negativus]MBH8558975.1 hypothetical protein [Hymenobacter negativus]
MLPYLDPALTQQLTDDAAHALRQALLPLAQNARRRLAALDPTAKNAAFVVRDVQQTEAVLDAVSAYHFAATGERSLATYNVAQLARTLAATTPAPDVDWQAITYRLFARFTAYNPPPSPTVARVAALLQQPHLQARRGWPLEQRQQAALCTSYALDAPHAER